MLGLFLRLIFFTVALVGLVLLFIYAAVVAVILVPVVLVLVFLLRRKGVVTWTTMDLRTARGPAPSQPAVIDHDPKHLTVDRRT